MALTFVMIFHLAINGKKSTFLFVVTNRYIIKYKIIPNNCQLHILIII